MSFRNNANFTHQQADKIGVLITNLGTPEAPSKAALKRYLKQFLADPRVVEAPRLLWWFILNFVILTIRPKRSAKAYQTVWTEAGSPLLVHTQAQAQALAERFTQSHGDTVKVEFAMRYGRPAIADRIQQLLDQGVRKLVVLPLYPQYSASTTASTFDAISEDFCQRRLLPELRFITHYHDQAGYITALANSVRAHWQQHGRADKLLLSYHGVPKQYLLDGDPYFCECHKTSRLVAEALDLSDDDYLTVFQSRFGRQEWLQPYCDKTLQALPAQGVKSVQIICPGFAADCLETIEEIGVENRDYFLRAGGERYEYIAALNASEQHIDFLHHLLSEHMQGWQVDTTSGRLQRAQQFGASQ